MMLRTAATVALALAIGAGVVSAPAHAREGDAANGDRVSRAAYIKVENGMNRARLARVTDNAQFVTQDGGGSCRFRRYKGWDRDHVKVYVLLDQQRKVAYKATTGPNEAISISCDESTGHPVRSYSDGRANVSDGNSP